MNPQFIECGDIKYAEKYVIFSYLCYVNLLKRGIAINAFRVCLFIFSILINSRKFLSNNKNL